MLQIIFLVIGLCIIVLTLSFVFKRYARTILWSSAIALFAGTLLLVGIGVINPVDEDYTGSTTFWGTIMTLISGAALAFCAEILKEKNKGKTNKNGNIIETPVSEEQVAGIDAAVVLSGTLKTELAEKVFAKAIEAGYIKEEGSHYKWTESKVLLAYMCVGFIVAIILSVLKWKPRHIGNSERNFSPTPNYVHFLLLLI